MNNEKYNIFIDEQKSYFTENLQSNFKWDWNDSAWYGGTIGSGWLLSRSGKVNFTFSTIKRLKGVENTIYSKNREHTSLSVININLK